jgi:nucleotide-binding universal stress UspA family protein
MAVASLRTGKEVAMPNTAVIPSVKLKSVLVASDFSEASAKPLRHALTIARHFGANFYLAHVVSSLGYTLAGRQALELASDAAARDAAKLQQDLVDGGWLAGQNHEFLVRQGIVWQELEQLVREKHADLLVIGTHGRKGLGKLLLGSIAEQIFRHADCLVLTVGPRSFQHSSLEKIEAPRTYLFATDFGPASLHALPYAIAFANQLGAKLVLLHVAPIMPMPEGFHWSETTGDVTVMQDNARAEALQRLQELILQNDPLVLEPQFTVKFGAPSKKILQVADTLKADLIIMGLNRSSHIDTLSHMPWATAYEVVCSASCPVLTVRK